MVFYTFCYTFPWRKYESLGNNLARSCVAYCRPNARDSPVDLEHFKFLYYYLLFSAILILFLLSVPCAAVHLNAETLMILVGQDHEEAR